MTQPVDSVRAAGLERIKHLAIPPAWRDVWISPNPLGHIQATGFDRAGRKQYRYHSAWRDLRDREKFDEVATFGEMLPVVRDNVEADLSSGGLGHRRVLGCAVRLLDLGSFRIGSDRYAVHDDTHGLTTLLAREVRLEDQAIVFQYVGKDHIRQLKHVIDAEAASIVAQLLGNTPAIARRSYVDPRVFDGYRAGWVIHPDLAQLGFDLDGRPPAMRRPVELAVLDLIKQRWDSSNLRHVTI